MILFIVLAAVSSNNKKKKRDQANARPRVPQSGQANLRQAASEAAPEGEFEEALERLNRKLQAAQAKSAPAAKAVRPVPVARAGKIRQGEPMLRDEECHGGSMAHVHTEGHSALADEDCFGGSMEHTHTEGVSRTDHARRMAAIDAQDGASDVLPETIDARALRRAVVMAEVLGKPRALRRN